MANPEDLQALYQAALSVQGMCDALGEYRQRPIAEVSDRIAAIEARLEGFSWVILGHNPPEVVFSAGCHRGTSAAAFLTRPEPTEWSRPHEVHVVRSRRRTSALRAGCLPEPSAPADQCRAHQTARRYRRIG
jgi:hypothetical protein